MENNNLGVSFFNLPQKSIDFCSKQHITIENSSMGYWVIYNNEKLFCRNKDRVREIIASLIKYEESLQELREMIEANN